MSTTLLEQQARQNCDPVRAAAMKQYRTLLQRADKPRKDDASALRTALAGLGKTNADVEPDLEIIRRAAELRTKVDVGVVAAGELPAAHRANVNAIATWNDAISRMMAKINATGAARLDIVQRLVDGTRSRDGLIGLCDQHGELLDMAATDVAAIHEPNNLATMPSIKTVELGEGKWARSSDEINKAFAPMRS